MLIQNGQIAHIVDILRGSNLSSKDETVKSTVKLLHSAIRQAEITDNECYREIGEQIVKILNNKKSREVKKDLLDKVMGSKVYSSDMANYYGKTSSLGRDICKGDWQQSLAKGIKNESQSYIR